MCSCDEADRVCSITIRMHGQDETGKHTGYIDGILNLEDVKPLLSDIGTADKASELPITVLKLTLTGKLSSTN